MTWIGTYILDDAGNPQPADSLEWAKWMNGIEKRRVDETWIAKGVRVSTVFLGLDHSFTVLPDPLHHKPVLWETMIFGGRLDQYQERYTSLDAAKEGHAIAVQEALRAEAGVKSFLLRRRDELARVWEIVYWFAFQRWYRKIRNRQIAKRNTDSTLVPLIKAGGALNDLNDSRMKRTVTRAVIRPLQNLGRRFKDE